MSGNTNPQLKAAYERAYFLSHKDQIDRNRRARELRNRQQITANMRRWRSQHVEQARATVRRSQTRRKADLFEGYGGKCALCGETESAFFVLDHINGGGKAEKRNCGGPKMIWIRLRREGWPPTHQILCANCNASKWRAASSSNSKPAATFRQLRAEMMMAYGGHCECCGETNPLCLELDHINGDGAKDRRESGGQLPILRRLRRENWPTGYQLLCANCNMAKQRPDGCPHQQSPDARYFDHPALSS